MVQIIWTLADGWHDAAVVPYGPISLDPAASVLHYAQEIFEGLKAYRHADGSVWTFRPDMNALRLQRSAVRLALPQLPEEYFLESLRQLLAVDASWVPSAPETSLYLRPFMIASESFLGVRAAHKVDYRLIASPAGAYFHGGVTPVSIWLSTEYARAGRGGTGAAKTGGNYASSLLAAGGCLQAGLPAGALPRLQRGEVPRGARRHERLPRPSRRHPRHAEHQRLDPRGHHPRQHHPAREGSRARGRGASDPHRRVARRRRRPARSSRRSPAEPRLSSPRSPPSSRPDFTIGDQSPPPGEFTMSIRQELTDIQYGRKPDHHSWMMRLA